MKIHPEGKTYIILSGFLFLITLVLYLTLGGIGGIILLLAATILFALVINFFRNPARPVAPDSRIILSPADGKVVTIEKVWEPEYYDDERWQISIFMSPLNVHVNRFPISGTITHYTYHQGKYLVAWHPKSSTENERNTIVIENHQGQSILLRQIAGAVARRIVCRLKPGMQVQQGDELGFIKFGSRVDVYLPQDAVILVQPNQLVKGNVDVLARWEG